MRSRRLIFIWVGLVCLTTSASAQSSAYTDTLYLINGDRIIGNVKNVFRGRLEFSTDNSRRISFNWQRVASIHSPKQFQFLLANRQPFVGRFRSSEVARVYEISDAGAIRSIQWDQIVWVHPIGESFLQRLDGSVNLGFDFTQANKQSIWNFNGDVGYRSLQWRTVLDAQSYFNFQDSVNTVSRNSIGINSSRYFEAGGWSITGSLRSEQNDELSLDYRNLAALAAAISPIQSHLDRLETRAGLSANVEKYSGDKRTTNLEGILWLKYEYFTFSGTETDLVADLVVFPSLTDLGRFRFDGKARISWEIIFDLTFGFNAYFVGDTRPALGARKTDYGFSTFVGYRFGK